MSSDPLTRDETFNWIDNIICTLEARRTSKATAMLYDLRDYLEGDILMDQKLDLIDDYGEHMARQ